MAADARDRLTSNIAGAMASVPEAIQQRQIAHFTRADPAYGQAVAAKLEAARRAAGSQPSLSVAKEAAPHG